MAELATAFAVNAGTVRKWLESGLERATPKGEVPVRISFAATVAWHEQRAQRNPSTRDAAPAADPTGDTRADVELSKLKIDVRTRELKYEILAGRMILAERHHRALSELGYNVRQRMRAIPESLAPSLVGLDDHRDAHRILLAAIDDALLGVISDLAPAPITVDAETADLVHSLES